MNPDPFFHAPFFHGMFPRHLVFLFLAFLVGCNRSDKGSPASDGPKIMVDLEPVAQGRHLRVVWVQSAAAGQADVAAQGTELFLMGLDSMDDRGIRKLRSEKQNYYRPLLMADGKNVVYTQRGGEPGIFMLPWDGGAPIALGTGVAVAVWREVGVSVDWIYAVEQLDEAARGGLVGKRLVRFKIDSPQEREIVWAQTSIDVDGVQLSRDGKHASALLPAPEASRLNFNDSAWKKLASATWPGMAPDNSYVTWTLDADRGALLFHAPNQYDPWTISLSALGGIGGGRAVWHPRWSNHVGIFAFTGPYLKAPNQPDFDAATQAVGSEIFIARLGGGATDVLSSVQVTSNDRGDAYPDVWVEHSFLETLTGFDQSPEDKPDARLKPWPVTTEAAQFLFNNAATDSPIPAADGTRMSRPVPKQLAKLGRFWDLDVSRGYYEADEASSKAIAPAVNASNAFTVEALITESRDQYQQLSVRLLAYRQADGTEALGIYRVDNTLIMRIRSGTSDQSLVYPVKLTDFRIDNDRPYHFVVTCDGANVKTYLGGSLVGEVALEMAGLQSWTPGMLVIGDPSPFSGDTWFGRFEGLAFFSRALPAEEIQQHFDAAQQKIMLRKPTDRVKLRAKLVEITPLPPGTVEGPYPRVLTSRTYDLEQMEAGIYEEKSIVVLHDAILNRQELQGLPDKVGEIYTLLVEPTTQHPQLKVAQILNGTSLTQSLPYLEVTPPKLK